MLKKLAIGGMLAAGVLWLGFAVLFYGLKKPELNNPQSHSQAVFSANGQLLRLQLAKDQRYRLAVSLEDVASLLVAATIFYEDKNFYHHNGVDFAALLRAALSTYITKNHRVGASTLTMQVAKLRFGIASHTVLGKLQQIIRAWQLEHHYSKQAILQAYFNLAPYGANIEGVQAASLIYFNKPSSALNMAEAFSLAVIPQNPNKRYLGSAKGRQQAFAARKRLWQALAEQQPGYAKSLADANLAINARGLGQLPFKAPHFVDYVTQQLGYYHQGAVHTTLDVSLQQQVEQTVARYLQGNNKGFDNAAVLILDYQTMAIQAMLGSADFFNKDIDGQVNGTLAKRSPGSTLKPFVYALALEQGLIHSQTLLSDAPRRFAGFSPENFDQQFLGPVLATDALILSRNVPVVNLQQQLQGQSLYQLLQKASVSGLQAQSHYGLALSLGAGELTMLELAQLYAALANQGQFQYAQFLPEPQQSTKTLLSPEASFIVLDMLRQNPRPLSYQSILRQQPSFDVAWKTGTSWAFRDAWSIAVAGDYVVAVWLGHFDGRSNHALIGRQAAAPLLFQLLSLLPINADWRISDTLKKPVNVRSVAVCASTGGLYQKHCPAKKESLFIPGVSPIATDTIYRQVIIDQETGLRLCHNNQTGRPSTLAVYPFWPSEFLQVFQQAGISLKKPPAFLTPCAITGSNHRPPSIVSPTNNVAYVLDVNQQSVLPVLLKAHSDGEVSTLYWFSGKRFLGSHKAGGHLMADFAVGEHQLKVVDDHGNTQQRKLYIMSAH